MCTSVYSFSLILGANGAMRPLIGGEIARCYEQDESNRAFSSIGLGFSFGFFSGPALMLALKGVDFHIRTLHITYANLPGLLGAVTFIIAATLLYFVAYDLSKEYDPKAMRSIKKLAEESMKMGCVNVGMVPDSKASFESSNNNNNTNNNSNNNNNEPTELDNFVGDGGVNYGTPIDCNGITGDCNVTAGDHNGITIECNAAVVPIQETQNSEIHDQSNKGDWESIFSDSGPPINNARQRRALSITGASRSASISIDAFIGGPSENCASFSEASRLLFSRVDIWIIFVCSFLFYFSVLHCDMWMSMMFVEVKFYLFYVDFTYVYIL